MVNFSMLIIVEFNFVSHGFIFRAILFNILSEGKRWWWVVIFSVPVILCYILSG